MSVRKVFAAIFLSMGIILSGIFLLLYSQQKSTLNLALAEERRFNSYILADELRQSSDDLTRMARVYVVTGDIKYLEIYNEILDIRNGKKPRPLAYERIYWDFVADDGRAPRGFTEPVALNDLMKNAGFTDDEFELLRESERNSNELVNLEMIAINAVMTGELPPDATDAAPGEQPDAYARRILHDARYHRHKATIMQSIDKFLEKLDARTMLEVESVQMQERFYFTVIFTCFALLVLAVILSYWYIHRNISFPVTEILKGVGKNSDGTYRIQRLEVRTTNEIGHLVQGLNGVISQVHSFINKSGEMAENLSDASRRVYSGADRSSSMTKQVALSISGVAQDISAQIGSINESIDVLGGMIDNLRKTSGEATSAAEKFAKSEELVSEGVSIVKNAITQMEQIEATVNSSAGVIEKLGMRSREIEEIVNTISSIAGRTNLLALNAAIEAARAGEQGRGFAVVAEEVGTLAESSQEAAKRIGQMIAEIRSDTDSAVEAMEIGTREAKNGADVVNMAGSIFRNIASITQEASQSVRDLSQMVGDLASSGEHVVKSVEASKDVFLKTDKEAQNVAQASENQLASMEEVVAACKELSELAKDMQEGITIFTI